MGNVKFDYSKVSKTTESVKKSADSNLKTYAETEYKKMKDAMKKCKGDYKNAIIAELEVEKKTVQATADFIIKLQDMMQKTATAFQNTDASYASGAVISDK